MRQSKSCNIVATCCLLISITISGCKSFQENVADSKLMFWKKKEITDGSNAKKMVAIWSESMTYGDGKTPMRGVGGRLYFYDQQRMPTKIEGDLIVYVYDDEQNSSRPDRKVVIEAEEFAEKYSETDFGPSYSVWIPWDKVGSPQKSISLVPVFKSSSGMLVVGDHSRTILPGKSESLREKTTTFELNARKLKRPQNEVQPVSFDDSRSTEDTELSPQPKNPRRHTIHLSPSLKNRLIDTARTENKRLRLRQNYGQPTSTIYGELPSANPPAEDESPIRSLIGP